MGFVFQVQKYEIIERIGKIFPFFFERKNYYLFLQEISLQKQNHGKKHRRN